MGVPAPTLNVTLNCVRNVFAVPLCPEPSLKLTEAGVALLKPFTVMESARAEETLTTNVRNMSTKFLMLDPPRYLTTRTSEKVNLNDGQGIRSRR